MTPKKITCPANFTAKNKQIGSIKRNLLIILISTVVLSLLAWVIMPASFGTDLSKIGQGRPAVALIYDFEDGRSQTLLKSFNEIRETYEDRIDFLVADVAAPQGRKFAQTRGSLSVSAHFFSADGTKVLILEGAHESDVVKKALKQAYGF